MSTAPTPRRRMRREAASTVVLLRYLQQHQAEGHRDTATAVAGLKRDLAELLTRLGGRLR